MTVFRMHCSNCLAFTKVLWDTASPVSMHPGEFKFCPRCGAKGYHQIDHEADYWEVLSGQLGDMPVELIKMLYSEWDRHRYPKFRDYVDAEVQSFDDTGDFMSADAADAEPA